MVYRESYSRFTPVFLERQQEVFRQDVFHHVLTYLLFTIDCRNEHLRQNAILTLGMDYYHSSRNKGESGPQLDAIKIILEIPDSTYLADHYEDSYPLWLIQRDLKARIEDNSFKMVDQLGWTMLKMSKAYYIRYRERRASLTEALRLTLGETPLKSGDGRYIAGEKTFSRAFNKYRPVCHFIMAFEYMRRGERVLEDEEDPSSYDILDFSIDTADQVDRFLSLALWFRKELRELVRPNVKDPALFPESELIVLPEWINCKGVDISIKPHAKKLRELDSYTEFFESVQE